MTDTLALTKALIDRPSVTPADAGCQPLIAERLEALGWHTQSLNHGEVSNLLCLSPGHGPLLLFLGHTDVVPAEPQDAWRSPPFTATARDGVLYGRGAADMKSSVAAFITACERTTRGWGDLGIRIGVLLTSDEEGPARDGIRALAPTLSGHTGVIDWCLVGEPSSQESLGDVIRIGRRGSLSGDITLSGRQGHVAYPDLADNALHHLSDFLSALIAEHWDDGTADFPPTHLEVTGIETDTDASNVIPGQAIARFNLRFSPASTKASLTQRIEALARQHSPTAVINWNLSAEPFISAPGLLRAVVAEVITANTGQVPIGNTAGGTSDGRFIAPLGAEVVEFGPINASIHQVDEHIVIAELNQLSACYEEIIKRLAHSSQKTDLSKC